MEVLNINFHVTDHCNNNCRWCTHLSPSFKPRDYDANKYVKTLDYLKSKNISFEYMCLEGGEPFLHKNLDEFINICFKTGSKLLLVTNGFWLNKDYESGMYDDIFSKLSKLTISVYPNMFDGLKDERILKFQEYIKNFDVAFGLRNKSYFCEWDLVPKFERKYPCINNDDILLSLDYNRIFVCGVAANLFKHPKFDIIKDLDLDSYSINLETITEESFEKWLSEYMNTSSVCQYCTFSIQNNMGRAYYLLNGNKPVQSTYELFKTCGVLWEKEKNETSII